jgi:phage shock protein C
MFCPQCGKQVSDNSNFCSFCGRALVYPAAGRFYQARIVRPREERMVAGVLAGIALRYDWDLTLVRILFVVLVCLTSGLAAVAYLAAWVLMPDAQYALPAAPPMPNAGQGSSI